MTIHIIPDQGDFKEIVDKVTVAGVPFQSVESVREFILFVNDNSTCVCTLRAQDLMVLNQHASSLLAEVPTVVVGVPGLVYSSEWMTMAASLVPIDWVEFQKKVVKSGTLALNPSQLEKRGRAGAKPDFDDNVRWQSGDYSSQKDEKDDNDLGID